MSRVKRKKPSDKVAVFMSVGSVLTGLGMAIILSVPSLNPFIKHGCGKSGCSHARVAAASATVSAGTSRWGQTPRPRHKAGNHPTVGEKGTGKTCPVMGNRIADAGKASGKSVYKGKTYYFCCPACKPMFDKNPAKYVKTKTVRNAQ